MPKLYSAREILKALQRAGFIVVSQKGSHIKLRRMGKEKMLNPIVPNHNEVARGTFQSILEQAEMTEAELKKHL
jgi:predicted RNA binding protein YcfA (HicA-like mRNA interferase family)